MARGFVEIRAKAVVAETRSFGNKIGKRFNHEVLRFVDIMEIAVDVEHQTVAVAFHQSLQSAIITAQKSLVQRYVIYVRISHTFRRISFVPVRFTVFRFHPAAPFV